jgi:predicted nucleotide-binding protein
MNPFMSTPAFTPNRSTAALEKGIERLEERVTELKAFDLKTVSTTRSAQLARLSAAIDDTLERCFGQGTSAYERLKAAIHLQPQLFRSSDRSYYYQYSQKCIERSLELLNEAQRTLGEDLADAALNPPSQFESMPPPPSLLSRRIFVVHGHDGEARKMVTLFLEKQRLEPIILSEQSSQGGTVIEKIEANRDVGFAVVLMTPDDVGRSNKEQDLRPRARQNVVLELGYFMAHLSRKNICLLKWGELEMPSDLGGMVWVPMDGNDWKRTLAQELEEIGYPINWKTVASS